MRKMSTPVSATELAPKLAKVFSCMGWSAVKPEQLQVVAGILPTTRQSSLCAFYFYSRDLVTWPMYD